MRKVNVGLLAILVGCVVLGGTGVYLIHRHMVRRNAYVYLDNAGAARREAEQAAAAGNNKLAQEKYRDALRAMGLYVQLRPDDLDAREEMGLLMAELLYDRRMFEQAFGLLQAVVREDPGRSKARRKLTQLLLLMRPPRYSDAREHIENHLLRENPKDAELLEWLGACQAGLGDEKRAEATFAKAVEADPKRLTPYVQLAVLLRRSLRRDKDADQWIEKMVEANGESAQAQVMAGEYLRDIGRADEAMGHAMKALELEADNVGALTLAAQLAAARGAALSEQEQHEEAAGQFEIARQYVQKGIDRHPEQLTFYLILVDVETRLGKPDEALRLLEDARKKVGDHPQLLWSLGNLLIARGKIDEANKVIAKMRDDPQARPFAAFLDAEIKMLAGRWKEAVDGFEQARAGLRLWQGREMRTTLAHADFLAAGCYEKLGNPDQRVRALRRALDADPSYAAARSALVQALLEQGDTDEAIQEMRQFGAKVSWLAVARLWTLRNLRAEPAQRNWQPVERALDEAAKQNPDAPEIILLRAEVAAAQGHTDQAETLLREARDKAPGAFAIWNGLINLAARSGRVDKALRLVDEAEARFGDVVDVRLARARCLALGGGAEAAAEIARLAGEKLDAFSPEDRLRLWNGTVPLLQAAGGRSEAIDICRRIAAAEPANVPIRFTIFELLLPELADPKGDPAKVAQALDDLKRVEGGGPLWNFGEALRLVQTAASSGDMKLLDTALGHLRRAQELRPTWSRIPLAMATIHDMRGNVDLALDRFLEAIRMGDRNPGGILRAVELLMRQQRWQEADQIRALLGRKVPLSNRFDELDVVLSQRLGRLDQAVEAAKRVAETSKDYRDHARLGQLLTAQAQRLYEDNQGDEARLVADQAKSAYRRAVELSPESPEAWLLLVDFLKRTGQLGEALEAIDTAVTKIPADKAPLALAQLYVVMDQAELAKAKFDEALAAARDDLVTVRAVAEFYRQIGELSTAENQLTRIIKKEVPASDEDVRWAKRRLAEVRVARGTYLDAVEALKLVEENLAAEKEPSPEDLRVKAGILAVMPSPIQRQQAIEVFESLKKRLGALRPDDQFLLAKLYLRQNEYTRFLTEMRPLLTGQPKETASRYLATYIAALLDRNELSDAQLYLERLESIAPHELATAGLKAEVFFRQGKYQEAVDVLKAFLDDPQGIPAERVKRLPLIADAMDKLSRRLKDEEEHALKEAVARDAEMLYRDYFALTPGDDLRIAPLMARQGRINEALDELERQWQKSNPRTIAETVAVMLREGKATAEQQKRAEDVLAAAAAHPEFEQPQVLMMVQADAYTLQERYKEAERIYREVIRRNARHAVAMNNLAVLLAHQKRNLDEALKLINQAIELSGPLGAMLDSRATVYLAMNQPQKALADLELAVQDDPNPIRLFHLAQAHDMAGDKRAAIEALKKANAKGLTPDMLQRPELPTYALLQKLLQ